MPATLTACEETGRRFRDYRVIILENNSNDYTAGVVKEWMSRNHRVRAVSETVPSHHERVVNIGRARNRALKLYMEDPAYADFPYFLLVDCDFEGGWAPEAVTTAFLQNGWAGVCSNGTLENCFY